MSIKYRYPIYFWSVILGAVMFFVCLAYPRRFVVTLMVIDWIVIVLAAIFERDHTPQFVKGHPEIFQHDAAYYMANPPKFPKLEKPDAK
ncbi:MAG: hypothetical protein KW788_01125 [Candidatus Doudnabacteria bacterium]|nr:hypothetical protein [Candidatus Doudnabacteria bacterium]